MNTIIYRVLGATDEELRNVPSESNVIELARLLFFLCVVAYNMRTIEMRCGLLLMNRKSSQADRPPCTQCYVSDF
jgi:hypothetical protein